MAAAAAMYMNMPAQPEGNPKASRGRQRAKPFSLALYFIQLSPKGANHIQGMGSCFKQRDQENPLQVYATVYLLVNSRSSQFGNQYLTSPVNIRVALFFPFSVSEKKYIFLISEKHMLIS